MQRNELLRMMKTRSGWSLDELAEQTGMTTADLVADLEAMLKAGDVHRSLRGRWRAKGAVTETSSSDSGEWGRRTRILVYSPEILVACPEFTRNTFLHFVEDEDHHFRFRDYIDGKRIEVKEVVGITLSRELASTFPRFELPMLRCSRSPRPSWRDIRPSNARRSLRSPPETARLAFDHIVQDRLQEIVDTNFKLYKRVADDKAFADVLVEWLYDRFKKEVE